MIDSKGKRVQPPRVDVVARYEAAGKIVLPTGRIIASDAQMFADLLPFQQRVAPGEYDVQIVTAKYADGAERLSIGVIRFAASAPVRWVNAPREDEDPEELKVDEWFAYGVDTGCGCFADAAAIEALSREPRGSEYGEWINGFDAAARVGSFRADDASGANLVVFAAGMGDGSYSSYFGYDESGAVCCLMTDFDVINLAMPSSGTKAAVRREMGAVGAKRKWWRFW